MKTRMTPYLAVAVGVLADLLSGAAGAQEPALYEAEAQALVEAVMDRSAEAIDAERNADLASWAESVIGQALDETKVLAGTASVSVDTHTAMVARGAPKEDSPSARTPSAGLPSAELEVIVFMSLAVPEPSWRQWSREAARIGAPMVLRGVLADGFMGTVDAIRARQGEDGAGAGIDPRLFRLFRIGHVPAVAVVPGGVGPCTSPGCSADPPPPHDLVGGNIGLEAALEAIARDGGPGRDSAKRHLAVLRGESIEGAP